MQLNDHDLRQLDGERLRRLREQDPRALERLAVRLLEDLKEARERLNQNLDNSSRPPSSRAPWSRRDAESETDSQDPLIDPKDRPTKTTETNPASPPSNPSKAAASRRPGKQKGAPGQARIEVLAFARPEDHPPTHCVVCGAALPSAEALCYRGYESVDVALGDAADPGLRVISTQHRYFQATCGCGHLTRCEPYRAPPAVGDWAGVALTQMASDRSGPGGGAGVAALSPAPAGAPVPRICPGAARPVAVDRGHPAGAARSGSWLRADPAAHSGGNRPIGAAARR